MDALADYGSSSNDEDENEDTGTVSDVVGVAEDVIDELVKPKAWEALERPMPAKPKVIQPSLVKIALPELEADSDSEDEGTVAKKRKLMSDKKSTLLTQLPAPVGAPSKKTTSLMLQPPQLRRKLNQSNTVSAVIRKAAVTKPNLVANGHDPDSDGEDNGDFFSLDDTHYVNPDRPVQGPSKHIPSVVENPLPEPAPVSEPVMPATLTPTDVASLPQEFMSDLRSEKVRLAEFEAQGGLIDVKADSALGNVHETLMRNVAAEAYANELRRSAKVGIQATNKQRQRHQLHWLAQVAKEREIDEQLQWQQHGATSRGEKGGSKYGFH